MLSSTFVPATATTSSLVPSLLPPQSSVSPDPNSVAPTFPTSSLAICRDYLSNNGKLTWWHWKQLGLQPVFFS